MKTLERLKLVALPEKASLPPAQMRRQKSLTKLDELDCHVQSKAGRSALSAAQARMGQCVGQWRYGFETAGITAIVAA